LFDAATKDSATAAAINAAFVPIREAQALAGMDNSDGIIDRRRTIAAVAARPFLDELQILLELERQTYLVSLLQRMDRMTMAVGLEARVPLLDERILEFALGMDSRQKLDARDSKKPVRLAAQRRFGREYAHATKFGFGVPLAVWMCSDGPLYTLMKRIFDDSRTRERGWIDVSRVRDLLAAHRRRAVDASEILWGALNRSFSRGYAGRVRVLRETCFDDCSERDNYSAIALAVPCRAGAGECSPALAFLDPCCVHVS
jgi:hypothetical protein